MTFTPDASCAVAGLILYQDGRDRVSSKSWVRLARLGINVSLGW